ncbi:hypothetical protein [Knoellia sp. LjRoot47]|uniref:hypothetical protein n=1 Tax=Knoellia sp. LjRoot47 TaxID=3342330 RepID=UPI003ED09DD4
MDADRTTANWEDPPPDRRGQAGVRLAPELLAEMQANPGRWMKFPERLHRSTPYRWSKRFGLEVTVRKIAADGTADIYLRVPEATS